MSDITRIYDEFERTLYHEAGHAVMAVYTGREIATVTADLDPDFPDFSGFMRVDPLSKDYSEDVKAQWLSLVAVLMAGPIAEKIKFNLAGWPTSGRNDLLNAQLLIFAGLGMDETTYDESRFTRTWDFIFAKTEKELLSRWAAVEAVVLELIGKNELSGSEVYAIVEKALSGTQEGAL